MASVAANLATVYLSSTQQVEIILTGTATSWTGGTTFSVTGGTGASVASQSVASGTSAAIKLIPGTAVATLTISDGTNTTTVSAAAGIIIAPNDSGIRHIGPVNVGSQEAISITTGPGIRFCYTGNTARIRFNVFGLVAPPSIWWRVDNGGWTQVNLSASTPFVTVAPTYTNATTIKSNVHLVEIMYACWFGDVSNNIWSGLVAAVKLAGVDLPASSWTPIVSAAYGATGTTVTAGAGGLAANSIGTTTWGGGNGADGGTSGVLAGGGGAAGGTAGGGGNAFQFAGGTTNAGTAGGSFDGTAGAGGTEFDATHGIGSGGGGSSNLAVGGAAGSYGGGGGGGGTAGGAGGNGLLVISYNSTKVFLTSGSVYTIPADFNTTTNTIEAVGPGGNGGFVSGTTGGGGGGGGAYAKLSNYPFTPGQVVGVQIGAHGTTNATTMSLGGLMPAPRMNPNVLMTIGDSITQTALELSPDAGTNDQTTEAPHIGYSKYLADYLGFDLIQLGYAGQGVTTAGLGGVPIATAAFGLAYSGVPYTPANLPVIVFIYQGTNDSLASSATFQADYLALVVLIRAAYPHCYIFAANPYGCTRYTDIRTALRGISNVTILDASTGITWQANDFTVTPHLSPGGHAKLANYLAGQFAAQIVSWWAAIPPTTSTTASTSMSVTYANSTIHQWEGVNYVTSVTVPATEADLLSPAVPIAILPDTGLAAVITLVIAGGPSGNTAYIVLQTSLDQGTTWIDVAWVKTTSTTNGTLLFTMAAFNTASLTPVNQTRASNADPGSTAVGSAIVGGMIRFTGKATLTGGSSPTVKASINYKLQPLR